MTRRYTAFPHSPADPRRAIELRCEAEPMSGCWLWLGAVFTKNTGNDGPRAKIFSRGKSRPAAQVSYEVFKGPIVDGLWVLHRCDNPMCVNPDHLYLGTPKQNTDDMIRRGRARMGGSRKRLTDAERAALTAECFSLGVPELMAKYGVTQQTVGTYRRKVRPAPARMFVRPLSEGENRDIEAMADEVVRCSGGSKGTIYAALRDAYQMGRDNTNYDHLKRLQQKDNERWERDHPSEEILF